MARTPPPPSASDEEDDYWSDSSAEPTPEPEAQDSEFTTADEFPADLPTHAEIASFATPVRSGGKKKILIFTSDEETPAGRRAAPSPTPSPVVRKQKLPTPPPAQPKRGGRRKKYEYVVSSDSSASSSDEGAFSTVIRRRERSSPQHTARNKRNEQTCNPGRSRRQKIQTEIILSSDSSDDDDYDGELHSTSINLENLLVYRESDSENDLREATVVYPGVLKPRNVVASKAVDLSLGAPKPTASNSALKRAPKVPPPPHSPGTDAFWDPAVVDEWHERHSPQKKRVEVRIWEDEDVGEESEYDSMVEFIVDDSDDGIGRIPKAPKTPKRGRGVVTEAPPTTGQGDRKKKKEWEAKKVALAEEFLELLDVKMNNGDVGRYYESKGGLKVVWNPKFLKTAGRAKLSRGIVELSDKVITDESRLYNTVAHEYCHLAVWAISKEKRDAHGPVFKQWGARVSAKFREYNITVTTKHDYEIDYKYQFDCQTLGCTYIWQQHSKPKDMERKRCPWCRVGKLIQVKPPPREAKPPTAYQLFTKQHMSRIKQENPGSPHKEVMKILSNEWKRHKEETPLKKSTLAGERWQLDDMPDTKTAARNRMPEVIELLDSEDEEISISAPTPLDNLMSGLKL